MKTPFLIGLLLGVMSISGFAQEAPPFALKTEGHTTMTQQKLIKNALLYINDVWASNGKAISRSLTEQYFDPKTELVINGKTVYTGYDQLEGHFQKVGQNIHGKFQFPFYEAIYVNHKVIVRFDEDIVDNQGVHYPSNVMATFTLHNGKIQRWEEVVNSKYFSQPESTKVVFSK